MHPLTRPSFLFAQKEKKAKEKAPRSYSFYVYKLLLKQINSAAKLPQTVFAFAVYAINKHYETFAKGFLQYCIFFETNSDNLNFADFFCACSAAKIIT